MENCASEKQLREIITDTKAVLTAIETRNNLKIGRLLDKRSQSIKTVKAAGALGKNPTAEERALADEILLLDKELLSKLEAFKNESGDSAQKQKKKSIVFKKYNYDMLEMPSSHLMDKHR